MAAMGERRVVITGMGVVTPLGIGLQSFWDALIDKRSGIGPIKSFDASGLRSRVAGEVEHFRTTDYVPKHYRKHTKVMCDDIKLAVAAAYHAVRDAGLRTKCLIERGEAEGPPNVDPARFGASIGAGLICADLPELAGALATAADDNGGFSLARWGTVGMHNLTPLWLLKFLPNMLGCHVTIVHDAQAASNTITCGEASSHLAIGEAYRTIARGTVDVMICGGAESKVNPTGILRQQLFGRLNTESNGAPERASCPFGAEQRGMVAAEGGGLVVLEARDHARARHARIYAEVIGFGASGDTRSWSEPDPEGRSLARAIRHALADAGIGPTDVDLATTFGVGCAAYDRSESAAWDAVLGDRLAEIPALAVKGAIGNNGAGSGAIDFAAAVMALHRNTVPPSLNTQPTDAGCRLQFVHDGPMDRRISIAVSVGFALGGGQNAALLVRKLEE